MPNTSIYYQHREPSPLRQLWLHITANPFAMVAFYIIAGIMVLMVLSPLISPFSSETQFSDHVLQPPAWHAEGQIRFLFGTDDLGRDLLSRVLHGSVYSLGYPLLATLLAAVIGISIGAWAGMSQGVQSSTLNHLLDVLLSIPSLLLALVIIAILGPALHNVMIAITLVLIPQFIHSVHNAFYEERNKEYVVASKLNGCTRWYLLTRVIFPNITSVVVMQITFALSTAILDIAALGFLGLGVQAPAPEWGTMLARSLDQVYLSPWTMVLPGLALFLTVLSINVLGDSVRAAIQERIRNS
ncbi:MAG: ABC transporter permease subunit [Pseudidiomarina maritima]|uniref:ABC transporter permease subunit n=1 Tax=Pseudidiomarina fusca TaxID=2965078 RepID=A0ABU3KTQ0_9GAMM|nr:ABC transporter permease subunit [Pseudidiomarina sp. GXY010]MDT7524853.1 ABC transporter permease subunit [Pseudidiomarina sp. GXY010]MDX1525163.1 ABC transporter permease subunit [Pseudidiomarina maritima]